MKNAFLGNTDEIELEARAPRIYKLTVKVRCIWSIAWEITKTFHCYNGFLLPSNGLVFDREIVFVLCIVLPTLLSVLTKDLDMNIPTRLTRHTRCLGEK